LEVREEVRQLAVPLADESGYELVDIEFAALGRHKVIRVLLDKPGGITLGDCATFSRRLGDCLEMNQTIPGSYRLEVSSPGMERPLRTLDAVTRFAGQRAALTTHEASEGRRHFEGTLLGPEGERVGVRLEDGSEHWFAWDGVRSARLVIENPWDEIRNGRAKDGAGGNTRRSRERGGKR